MYVAVLKLAFSMLSWLIKTWCCLTSWIMVPKGTFEKAMVILNILCQAAEDNMKKTLFVEDKLLMGVNISPFHVSKAMILYFLLRA